MNQAAAVRRRDADRGDDGHGCYRFDNCRGCDGFAGARPNAAGNPSRTSADASPGGTGARCATSSTTKSSGAGPNGGTRLARQDAV